MNHEPVQVEEGQNGPDMNFDHEAYFTAMGFAKDATGVQAFYFYSKLSKTLIRLTASKFSKANLLMLAPYDFWCTSSFQNSRNFDHLAVGDYLISACNAKGYFSLDSLRGRGAWIDEDRVIIHAGTSVFVNGSRKSLGGFKSDYVYELGPKLNLSLDAAMQTEESSVFANICEAFNWGTRADGVLLAGWIAIAPLCGVLNWRPHLWITGAKNSGKSYVFNNIVRKMTENISLFVQGQTTQSGIRQKLKMDAINVIFDEAEGETETAQKRVEEVMGLMRAASAAGGASILKGSATGEAQEYKIRSCFIFASIVPQVYHDSDKRRITVLELKKLENDSDFKELNAILKATITKDFAHRLQSRILNNIKAVLKTIEICIDAVTIASGSRAIGDQIGTMLGGWHHLKFDDVITEKQASKMAEIAIEDLKLRPSDSNDLTDEQRCLQAILSAETIVQSEYGSWSKNIGELVEISTGNAVIATMTAIEVESRLNRLGLRIITQEGITYLSILNTSEWVKERLKNTAWGKSHGQVLSRINGMIKKSVRYTAGVAGRSTLIPISEFLN